MTTSSSCPYNNKSDLIKACTERFKTVYFPGLTHCDLENLPCDVEHVIGYLENLPYDLEGVIGDLEHLPYDLEGVIM